MSERTVHMTLKVTVASDDMHAEKDVSRKVLEQMRRVMDHANSMGLLNGEFPFAASDYEVEMDMRHPENMAKKIAEDILTTWPARAGTEECTRVQLMLKQPDGSERNMGGRNKTSLIECIAENLRKKDL